MYTVKSKWEYLCELMVAVPGLASMFTDEEDERSLYFAPDQMGKTGPETKDPLGVLQ